VPDETRRKPRVVAIVVLAALAGIPLAAWALRGTLATSIARDELEARGLECDERFAVELGALFDTATVGPTRCTREGGIVAAVELRGPVTVELDGFAPASADVQSLRLSLRDTDVRGGSRWAGRPGGWT